MNYESEFQELMIDALKKQYGIIDDTILYHYFILRFYISREGKRVKKNSMTKELMKFVCEELNLPCESFFQYKESIMKKEISIENSLLNIVESWIFENSIRYVYDGKGNKFVMEEYIEDQQKWIMKQASNKAKPYKKTIDYKWHWKYHALIALHKVYNVTPTHAKKMEGIIYPELHEPWARTMEEICQAHIHVSVYQRYDVKTITEQDLENFLCYQLDLIEKGLVYIDRQVHIIDGRIDILAKDKEGTFCIIELKVADDKELLWQCIYYPMQIRKKYGVSNVRMITIAPSYPQSISLPLQSLGYVEMLTFTPKVKLGRIESILVQPELVNAVA